MLSCFSSINSNFDQWHVQKLVTKMTHSLIVELNQNNCRRKNCQTSHLHCYADIQKSVIFHAVFAICEGLLFSLNAFSQNKHCRLYCTECSFYVENTVD